MKESFRTIPERGGGKKGIQFPVSWSKSEKGSPVKPTSQRMRGNGRKQRLGPPFNLFGGGKRRVINLHGKGKKKRKLFSTMFPSREKKERGGYSYILLSKNQKREKEQKF